MNGATNIYKITYNAINNKGIPNYLSRSKNLSTGLDEPVKPKFTRLEIGNLVDFSGFCPILNLQGCKSITILFVFSIAFLTTSARFTPKATIFHTPHLLYE